ncbi:hypothetical protein FACS189464_1730 [Bacteroidia bacterium]|nr:hypothetical protein FACS189464_1730 [Bacteroidia bacterium]
MIPRQQVISFSALGVKETSVTTYTKYNHDKVRGVVILPDRAVFGDKIYLEINHQTVLPRGFDAGLISFRQFLNKDMKRCIYTFEEWARGSEINIIYRNNGREKVKIDLILLTSQEDAAPIEKRKKLQIVPVKAYPGGLPPTEPVDVRSKTDFYFDELTEVFNDYFNFVNKAFAKDGGIAGGFAEIAGDFLTLTEPDAGSLSDMQEDKTHADELLAKLDVYTTEDETETALLADMLAYTQAYSEYLAYAIYVAQTPPETEKPADEPDTIDLSDNVAFADIINDFFSNYNSHSLTSGTIGGLKTALQAANASPASAIPAIRTDLVAYLDDFLQYLTDHAAWNSSGGLPEPQEPELPDALVTDLQNFLAATAMNQPIIDYIVMPESTAAERSAKKTAGDALTSLQNPPQGDFWDYVQANNAYLAYVVHIDNMPAQVIEPDVFDVDKLVSLYDYVEFFEVYNDNYQSLSTLQLTVDATPIYPENYPIANILPRYRKTFNETAYKCLLPVKEADISIRFRHAGGGDENNHVLRDFNMYFKYNQTQKV